MPRSLTVDAVIVHDGRIVLIKRRDSPFKGCYALPGGYVEREEDAKEALAREVEEETGLIVTPGRMVGFYDDPERDRRGNVSIAAGLADVVTHLRQRLVGEVRGVRTHVGDEPQLPFAADGDALVESLGDTHGPLGAEAEAR